MIASEVKRIKELIERLNRASRAYYQEDREIMSNYQYDQLYDELKALEKRTGIVYSNSPTQQVGYQVLSNLPKERHEIPMLSLDKTKDIYRLKEWLGTKEGLLSWKLDGLTIVLTYQGGKLYKAVTRGNGEVGEVITNNARVFKNIPLSIPYKEELILRGEAVIKYSDFEMINAVLDEEEKYKNPRNLCSGTVRQLNNQITAERKVHFFAFQLVKADGIDFEVSKENQLKWLGEQGFNIVEYQKVTADNLEASVQDYERRINTNDFGSDGLVLTYEDIAYSIELGATSKFPRDSIAFKWADEIKETRLLEIKWNPSRTGLINPIAIFEPIELEGTTVSRASVHNVSILESLQLGEGDRIEVYKANMIIPQIAGNLTKSGVHSIPKQCPVCGGETEIRSLKDVRVLFCTNKACQAKQIKRFTHFVSRNAMNIEGLSEATLEKFILRGFIKRLGDIFRLTQYEAEITRMEGFGEKSYQNLIASIKRAEHVALPNFIYALGIQNIGLSNAKLLCQAFDYDFEAIKGATVDALIKIQGFGEILAYSLHGYFANEEHLEEIEDLRACIVFDLPQRGEALEVLAGKTFVITGSLNHYDNRDALKETIESLGGKVTGTVSSKTDYLINNDTKSASSKNKKAQSLNIPILSEEQFITMIGQSVE